MEQIALLLAGLASPTVSAEHVTLYHGIYFKISEEVYIDSGYICGNKNITPFPPERRIENKPPRHKFCFTVHDISLHIAGKIGGLFIVVTFMGTKTSLLSRPKD